jgi:hypothetical protein
VAPQTLAFGVIDVHASVIGQEGLDAFVDLAFAPFGDDLGSVAGDTDDIA